MSLPLSSSNSSSPPPLQQWLKHPAAALRPRVPDLRGQVAFWSIVLLVGCQGVGRLSECQQLIEEVNSGLADIREVLPDAGTRRPDTYRRVAERYQTLHLHLAQTNWRDRALDGVLEDYRGVLKRAENRARGFAKLLDKKPRSKRAKQSHSTKRRRQTELARGEKSRQTSVIRRINELCHPR